jgi:hypothetical protein
MTQPFSQSTRQTVGHRANIPDPGMDSAGIAIANRNGQRFAAEDFSKAK